MGVFNKGKGGKLRGALVGWGVATDGVEGWGTLASLQTN